MNSLCPGGSPGACIPLPRRRGPGLTIDLILSWADDHRARTGRWPHATSGAVGAAPGERWSSLATALRDDYRGLPGGQSISGLLAQHRGKPPHHRQAPLDAEQILAWADEHRRRTGRWPTATSGPIPGAPGEHWRAIDMSLRRGSRGLPGGSSLTLLLEQHRGHRRRNWKRRALAAVGAP
jgi:hypothetical protein